MSVNNRRTQLLFRILAGQLGVTILIVAMAFSILFYAEGYRFNYRNFKITRTGVLSVVAYPKNSTVTLNGKTVANKLPYSDNLLPSRYSVTVTKDGYSSWSAYSKIEPDLVTEYKNVVLFRKSPQISDLVDQRIKNLLNAPYDDLAIKNNHGLSYNAYEIWADESLVTRFSEPIYKAIWYTSDNDHVVYQQKNQIRAIEISGENDTLLVTLNSSDRTNFALNDKGDELYYIDKGLYKVAKIR